MPWCPQCRAEYREGFTRCHRCGVPLALTPPPESGWMGSAPPLVSRAAGQVVAAWRHATGAIRLLKRHPSLLLLPLALAFFDVAERQAGQHASLRYTAWGREAARRLQDDGLRPVTQSLPGNLLSVRQTVRHFASPITGVTLTGSAQLAWTAAMGRGPGPRWPGLLSWFALATSALVAVLSALVLAGYYGVAGAAADGAEVVWAGFGRALRRFWLRFWLLQVVLIALTTWLIYLALAVPLPIFTGLGNWWYAWVAPAISFLLALSFFALVVDDARIGQAMGRSLATIWRGLLTALLLLLGFGLLRALLLIPLSEAARFFFDPASAPDAITGTLLLPAWRLAAEGWDALVGVWLCLAMFSWYREAAGKRAPQPGRPTPAC